MQLVLKVGKLSLQFDIRFTKRLNKGYINMLLKNITTIIFLDVFIILRTFSFAIELCKFDSTLLGSVMIPSLLNKC